MHIHRQFIRSILILTASAFLFFSLEFLLEWNRLGRPMPGPPNYKRISFEGVNDNAKLVDVLSPVARAFNNMLAMLIAAVGLAIPLTANMHTPKLIEMFLRDKVNRIMLIFGAIGAAHVLWVAYLIGPDFAPMWAYRLAVGGAMLGWLLFIPYFFYVIRFLDPSNILARLKYNVEHDVERALHGKNEVGPAHDRVRDAMQQIGTIVLKSIDRADRGVAAEGIWSFKQMLDHYRKLKNKLPPTWFHVERRDLVGLSPEALDLLNIEGIWLEHAALWQLYLCYLNALTKAPDTLSALSDTVRVIGSHAHADGDERVLELTVRIFNNFLREAIKKKDAHAIYDLLYQYRRLALDLLNRPEMLEKIGFYLRRYSDIAIANGIEFMPQMLTFDFLAIVEQAYEKHCSAAPVLLRELLAIRHQGPSGPYMIGVKGKVILGARLLEMGLESEADQVRAALSDVTPETLKRAEADLLTLKEQVFWEVTDRQLNFEYLPPERLDSVRKFFARLQTAP